MNSGARKPKSTEVQGSASDMDDNRVIITGENQFLRISEKDGDPHSSEASFWRILFSPSGPGHVLYLKSELTRDQWCIYADNIAAARWLQKTVQGMLAPALKDLSIPVVDAAFARSGDGQFFWTERVEAHDTEIVMTWSDFGEPILVHSRPDQEAARLYGVCTVLVPALNVRLTVNGVQARGQAWPRDRMGRPYSTSGLGLSESWTEAVK
jgi:hypothetical protein